MDQPIVEFADWEQALREVVPADLPGGVSGGDRQIPLLVAGKRRCGAGERGRVRNIHKQYSITSGQGRGATRGLNGGRDSG